MWVLEILRSLHRHATRANNAAGFAKACEPVQSLQKTKTGQNKGLPVHLLLSGFPRCIATISGVLTDCWDAWGPDKVAHCLSSESCNYLFFPLHLLPLMPAATIATCNQSLFGLRTSFSLFVPSLCLSQPFAPAAAWELLSHALDREYLNPLLPLHFSSWQSQPFPVTHIPSVQPSGHAHCADGVYR